MKKKMIMMAAFLIAALTMNAQSIVGTWIADLSGEEFDLFIEFEENNDVTLALKGDINEDDIAATMGIIVSGTYKIEGKKVTFNFRKDEASIEINDLKLSGELAGQEELVKPLFEAEMEKQKDDFIKEMDFNYATIKSITADTLELLFEGDTETVVFRRSK